MFLSHSNIEKHTSRCNGRLRCRFMIHCMLQVVSSSLNSVYMRGGDQGYIDCSMIRIRVIQVPLVALSLWLSTVPVEAFASFSPAAWPLVARRSRPFVGRLAVLAQDDDFSLDRLSPEASKNYLEDESGNVHIPTSGISVSDEMEAAQKDRFVTEVVPVKGLPGVAQLVTSPTVTGSFEPVRYLVALSQPKNTTTSERDGLDDQEQASTDVKTDYVMMDIPPFSPQLVTRMKAFMGLHGQLLSILVTNRDAIHYDEAPSVFSTRRADLDLWLSAFPGLKIVAYRLDIPRDCRHAVSQVLDGYGPFGLQEDDGEFCFVESGRPLTYAEWDHDVAQDVLSGKLPPDDNATEAMSDGDVNAMYTPEAIRKREEGKRVLAVYTPGYSFGSVSYVVPEIGVCCSGYTIPVEDARIEENLGIGSTGPALDCRGYIAASKARKRQMESAKDFVNAYGDRFHVVLPSRGDPLFLDGDVGERKEMLLDTIEQYEKIGEIYEQLGIISDDYDD
jgi:hypothetical protein